MSSLDWGVRSLLTLHYESHHIHYSNLRYFNITSIRFDWISSLVATTVQISKIIQEKDSLAIANVLVRQGPVRTAIGRPPFWKEIIETSQSWQITDRRPTCLLREDCFQPVIWLSELGDQWFAQNISIGAFRHTTVSRQHFSKFLKIL